MWFAHVFLYRDEQSIMFRWIQYMNNQQIVPYVPSGHKQQRNKGKNKSRSARGSVKKNPQMVRDSEVIKAPVASTRLRRTADPVFTERLKNGDVTVTHREYLQDIPGSVAFSITQFPVNPAWSPTFPWLSAMASLYESYQFDLLEFEYQTESPTTFSGSVMSAVDYDASDAAPQDKQALASYSGYVRSAPWENFNQRSTKANLSKQKTFFTRSSALSANQDIKLYDTGNFFIATQGQTDASIVGELYVRYRVRLMTPQLTNTAVGLSRSSRVNTTVSTSTFQVGSNAPLSVSGDLTSGVITVTALNPYNGLIVVNGTATTPVVSTTGSTCTIQSPASAVNGTMFVYGAELAMSPGQTFVYTQSAASALTMRIGQYNTLVL